VCLGPGDSGKLASPPHPEVIGSSIGFGGGHLGVGEAGRYGDDSD